MAEQLVENLPERPDIDSKILRIALHNLGWQYDAVHIKTLFYHPNTLQMIGSVKVLNAANLEAFMSPTHQDTVWAETAMHHSLLMHSVQD